MNKNIFLINNQKGSILLELLAVIGIISLLISISIPFIRKYEPNLKLNATARELISDLRYAQQLTITEQKIYKVKFNIISNSYQIIKTNPGIIIIKTVYLGPEISLQNIVNLPDSEVIFNYYGAVSHAGQIILINTNAKTANINIKPSGYVELE